MYTHTHVYTLIRMTRENVIQSEDHSDNEVWESKIAEHFHLFAYNDLVHLLQRFTRYINLNLVT